MAGRLAENTDVSVLVIEAGCSYVRPFLFPFFLFSNPVLCLALSA